MGAAQPYSIDTKKASIEEYYPSIYQISTGPTADETSKAEGKQEATQYRLIFTGVEESTNLYVEKVELRGEGVDRQVIWSREIAILKMAGEIGRRAWVKIGEQVKWHSPTSATIMTRGGALRLKALNQKTVQALPVQ